MPRLGIHSVVVNLRWQKTSDALSAKFLCLIGARANRYCRVVSYYRTSRGFRAISSRPVGRILQPGIWNCKRWRGKTKRGTVCRECLDPLEAFCSREYSIIAEGFVPVQGDIRTSGFDDWNVIRSACVAHSEKISGQEKGEMFGGYLRLMRRFRIFQSIFQSKLESGDFKTRGGNHI